MNQLRDTFPDAPGAKRRFTADEFERMGMSDIFGPDERVELIAGEIYRMSPAGRFHEVLRTELAYHWARRAPANVMVAAAMQLRLSDDHQPVLDIGVWPALLLAPDARGPDMLLAVEIADTSLKMDTTLKAAAYAECGVREYWVINARTRETLIHREPGPQGYAVRLALAAGEVATPLLVPELSTSMASLPAA